MGHRLHLVVCNGLGLWLRKQSKSSLSNTPTASNTDPNDVDSDEDDYTDDLVFTSHSSSLENSSNSVGSLVQSFDASDDSLTNETDRDTTAKENSVDEGPDNLSIDITDNWSIDVVEEFDPFIGELIQQSVGVVMKKCRSMVKLVNKSSILMNYVISLKKQFNICCSLQLDCKGRWSSTHHLIQVILLYRRIINNINSEKHDIGLNIKQTNKISSIELDQFDWKILEILETLLRPFEQATNLISGSQYPTIGIAYFAITQKREFFDDSTNIGLHDMRMFVQLKQLLLKQIEKYFIEKDEQWNVMKVTILEHVELNKNLSCIKNYAYFDPIGFGCLSRRERRAIEVNLIDIQQQYADQEIDEEEINQVELTLNKRQKSNQSPASSMMKFLSSVGKRNLPSSSDARTTTKNKFNEEIITYGTLAQKEYSSIIVGEKEPDVVSAMQ